MTPHDSPSLRAIHLCKEGAEPFLAGELAAAGVGGVTAVSGSGRVLSASPATPWDIVIPGGLCFARTTMVDPEPVEGASVNALCRTLDRIFQAAAATHAFSQPWAALFESAPNVEGLPGRATSLGKVWLEGLSRRMPRVARLAGDTPATLGRVDVGMALRLEHFDKGDASARIVHWGQRRMRDDPAAPSRSYLKVEEAYGILGLAPGEDDTVATSAPPPGAGRTARRAEARAWRLLTTAR